MTNLLIYFNNSKPGLHYEVDCLIKFLSKVPCPEG
uniref:Uncharacterized protein n=1 Tax=Rhizophora mucronata TaxID=61149 RepID=A0A2P2IL80_RHIMU